VLQLHRIAASTVSPWPGSEGAVMAGAPESRPMAVMTKEIGVNYEMSLEGSVVG
jgi:hypothetical protein